MKYTIFRTKWGYFGLASTDNRLLRTCLPLAEREKAKSQLLRNLPDLQYDKDLFKTVQKQITAYFEGDCVDFRDIPVVLACPERSRGDGLGLFTRRVLAACRKIPYGKTATYSQLARIIGKPGASRAVGNALAKNPIPLIIPCHRIICANGTLGGFSASGGVNLKKRMLKLEEQL
jgi:methylated-DNA-[protein]-cysteine S-methyltransferase